MVLFLCQMFTQRPINHGKIEQSYERCFSQRQFLANSIENFISHENKKWLVCKLSLPDIYKALKPILTLELSQYHKIGCTFSSSQLVAASRFKNTLTWLCVCACLSNQPKRVNECCLKSLAIDFALKTFDCLLQYNSNLNSAAWPLSCSDFLQPAPKTQKKVQ